MSTKLIGFPFAGGAGARWADEYSLSEVIGKCAGQTITTLTRHTMSVVTDITGAGAGKGEGKARVRAARATGQGIDPDIARAQCEEESNARSGWITELLAAEHSLGETIMEFAGGREFRAGKGVRLTGNGMAPRAARYLKDRRGRTPSDTSLEDGAAAAAFEMAKQVKVWEYVLSIAGELSADRLKSDTVIRSHVCGCGWRAAFHSYTDDFAAESGATNGRMAGEQQAGVSLALDAGQLATQAESLKAWASGARQIEDTAPAIARRAVSSWLWRSLVPDRTPGANAERARDCARRRARFLIRIVHGASWADAARLAGYADGAAASHSLAREHTWATLAGAQASQAGTHPFGRVLRKQWLKAARDEVRTRRNARIWINTSATRGARRMVTHGLPRGTGAGVLVNHFAPDRAPRVPGEVRSLGVDIASVARRAIDAREQAARVTSGARARLVAFRDRAAQDWTRATRGLRSGFLR